MANDIELSPSAKASNKPDVSLDAVEARGLPGRDALLGKEADRSSVSSAERASVARERLENDQTFGADLRTHSSPSIRLVSGGAVDRTREQSQQLNELGSSPAQDRKRRGKREFSSAAVQNLQGVLSESTLESLDILLQKEQGGNGLQISPERIDLLAREVSTILRNDVIALLKNGNLSSQERTPESVTTRLAEKALEQNDTLLASLIVRSAPFLREEVQKQAASQTRAHTILSEPQLQERHTALFKEVRASAQILAGSDFRKNPGSQLDTQAAHDALLRIAKKYPELSAHPGLEAQMAGSFENSYSQRQEQLHSRMSMGARQWYGATGWISSSLGAVSGFFSSAPRQIAEAAAYLTQEAGNLWTGAGEFLKGAASTSLSVLTGIRDGAYGLYTTLTSAETWNNVGSWISSAWSTVTNPATWSSIGTSIGNGAVAAWNAIKDPETWKSIGSALAGAASSAATWCYDVCTDPQKAWEALKSAGSFIKGLGDSLGVSDLLWGAVKLVEGAGRLALAPFQVTYSALKNGALLLTGQLSLREAIEGVVGDVKSSYGEALKCLGESTTAVRGALLMLGEITGITDCVMCAYHLSQGNFTMAAMHGGFALLSAGSIVATVVTAGAAAGSVGAVMMGKSTVSAALKHVGKVALSQFAKEGAEALAKNTGKAVMEDVVHEMGEKVLAEAAGGTLKSLSKEAIEEAGQEALEATLVYTSEQIVDNAVEILAQEVAEHGRDALTKEAISEISRESASTATEILLKELNIYSHVKGRVLDLLHTLNGSGMIDSLTGKSLGEVQQILQREGMQEAQAHAAASALRKALHVGMSDGELAEILIEGITDQVSEQLAKGMEATFRERFALALAGELPTNAGKSLARELEAKAIKLAKAEIDELVEAAWDGCKKGIREATERTVRRAVNDAFSEFRKRAMPGLRADLYTEDLSRKHTESAPGTAAAIEIIKKRAAESKKLQVASGIKRYGVKDDRPDFDDYTQQG